MPLNKTFKNEQGSISILVVIVSISALVITSFIGIFINGFTTATRLNNVADRVALGAATNLISNPENVCGVAMDLAINNEVKLQFCEVNDDEVFLRVRSDDRIQSWLDRWQQIGMARAGIDYAFE